MRENNLRFYALERMASDTQQVRAELQARAVEKRIKPGGNR